MELFKISEGPWERLFEGNFQGTDVEIYINTESIVLVVIFEKEDKKVNGAIVELFKIFYSVGETETFVETLPREVIVLTKHDEKETLRFFLLGSKPDYVPWKEHEFIAEVENHLKRLKTSAGMIKDVSKAYELTLKEIAECPDRIKEAFFSQPLLVPIFSTSAHFSSGSGEANREFDAAELPKSITKGEIILGITKDKKQVLEPLALFTKTAVSDGLPEERNHIVHIIIESCLLSNVSTVIFDWDNEFSTLNEASKERDKLQKYKVGSEPIGFPTKSFVLGQDLKIDLAMTNANGFVEIFGFGNSKSAQIIASAIAKEKPFGLTALIAGIAKIQADESTSIYEINRALRMLRILQLEYGTIFEGKTDMDELARQGARAIGRASILNLNGADERISRLFVHSMLNSIFSYYSKKGRSTLSNFVFLPHAEKFISKKESGIISKDISQTIMQFNQYGLGTCLEMQHITDLADSVRGIIDAEINVVEKNDAGIQLKNRKSYRVFVRPGLSRGKEVIF